jgi:Zn-dependent protease with chaperone function
VSRLREDGGDVRAGPDAGVPDRVEGSGRDLRVPHEPRGPRSPLQPVTRAPRGAHSAGLLSRRRGALLVLALFAFAPAAPAQTSPPGPTPASAIRESRDVHAYTLTPEKYRQAVAYSRARYRLHFIGFAWEVAILVALVAIRVAPRFRDIAERASRRRAVQALVFVPLFLVVYQLLVLLPVDAWSHRLSVRFGQSIQGWASWLWDWVKVDLIALLISLPIVWILYGILRRSPRRWWLWFWLATLPIVVFVIFIAPVVIDPLFFEYQPLAAKAPELTERIEKVTERGGLSIPPGRMFLMDASKKLNSLNAYVTGFGASKRVVVWDTTIRRMTTPQTLVIFGHEMGHYVLHHIPKTIVFIAALLLVLLLAAHLVLRRLFPEGRERWGIRGVVDWASLPILMLVVAVMSEIGSPAVSSYSRANEHAADVYSLEVIHGIVPDANRTAAEAFQILGEVNLADPDPPPFIRFWLYDHPPLAERLVFARTYDPWSKGQPPRYVRDRMVN